MAPHFSARDALALILRLALISLLIRRSAADTVTVSVTPHASYSSSIGVLGCKINTNRIAYWPMAVNCSNICVCLSYSGRTVNLLRVDQSGGAYDVSYDAWNYLYTGFAATDKPVAGGAVEMQAADVDPSQCADLIHTDGSKLPLSAANSMDFLASCLGTSSNEATTWVGQNHVLYNIMDPICTWGYDEVCSLDWPAANQPSCPHMLGQPVKLSTDPVYNVMYPSGQTVLASSGEVVANASSDAIRWADGERTGRRAVMGISSFWMVYISTRIFM
jgi:hypothetical protein